MSEDKYLLVILGPTAVGKTATCIELGMYFNTEVVSADSRQFYKEMEVGTAKPSKKELNTIKHHFINSHTIEEDVSAGQYEKIALAKLSELFETHNKVILTGGSGLYINSVTEGMAHIPKIDASIREGLNERLIKEGIGSLVKQLMELDPEYYEKVDLNNPHRVTRALEVCLGTGRPFSSFRKGTTKKRPFKTIKIGLVRSREELYERINKRMDLMIEQGLFEEAKQLYPYRSHNALQTVGYKEIFDYMDGQYDREEAIRLLKRNSRRYAKRQLTWFNKDEDTEWFHPDDIEDIIEFVSQLPK